jgi:hypothetical protein
MTRPGTYDWALLPFVGFLAGVAQCLLPLTGVFGAAGRGLFMFGGGLFGIAIAAYFWLFRGRGAIAEALVFILISAGALYVSILASIFLPVPLPFLDWPQAGQFQVQTSGLFRGGFVGAAILFAGFYLCFARGADNRQFFVKAFSFSVLGGFLGMAGWLLGRPLLAPFMNCRPGDNCEFISMFVIWQTGIASLLAFLPEGKGTGTAVQIHAAPGIPFPRPASPVRRSPVGPLMAILVTVIALVMYMAARQKAARAIQHREDSVARRERQWEMVGRPPTGRGTVEGPLPLEQVFILDPVGGYTFDHFLDRGTKSNPLDPDEAIFPPFISYRARFMRPNAIYAEEMDLVDVTVITYADRESARYTLEHQTDRDTSRGEPRFIRPERKFRNDIEVETALRDVPGSPLDMIRLPLESIAEDPRYIQDVYIRWTSGHTYVRLRFYGPEDDEFLRQYLAKYPSGP